MSRAVDDLSERWLSRIPDADEAYQRDAQYHAQITFMRRTLTAMELAMEDEGITKETRLRVIRAVIYGAPDEAAALARQEQHRLLAEKLMRQPLGPITLPWEAR